MKKRKLEALGKAYASDKPERVVYGEWRLGKPFSLRHFMRHQSGLYPNVNILGVPIPAIF